MSTAGSSGLVTIEDVIEQIVGEIDDEFDVEDDQNIRRDAERQFTVRGVTRIAEFNEYFGARLSEEQGFDTVAGLLMKQLGRLPRRGESADASTASSSACCAPTAAASMRCAWWRRATCCRRPKSAPRTARRAPEPRGRRRRRHRARGARTLRPRPRSMPHARAARAARRRGARRGLCAAQPVAARGALPGAAHVAVAGRRAARGRAARLLVQRRAPSLAGTYWLYISIHGFGGAPIWLALVLMLGLVGDHGAVSRGARLCACARWLPRARGARAGWSRCPRRGCSSSGGAAGSCRGSRGCRSATRRPTPGWPASRRCSGVYGMSALLLVCAGALTRWCSARARARIARRGARRSPGSRGAALHGRLVDACRPGPPVSVAVVQGAIPQDEKWLESNRDTTLKLYQSLTEKVLGTRLIVWPESAPADVANDLVPYISNLYREAQCARLGAGDGRAARGGRRSARAALLQLGAGARRGDRSWYDKHHLVPFAEFFPVPHFVRAWLRLMSLPYADFTPGRERSAAAAGGAPAARARRSATRTPTAARCSSVLPHGGRPGERHQRRLVRPLERAPPAPADRAHARAGSRPLPGAGRQRRHLRRSSVRTAKSSPALRNSRPAVLVSKIVPMKGLTPYARVGNWPVVLPGRHGAGVRAVGAE